MRRVATLLTLLLAAGGFAFVAGGAGESDTGNEYFVELDNAFGLIEGADLKIAGVRAGKLTQLKLDRKTKRAIVGFQVTRDGFGSLRTDATCATRPQSLIGEYFVDCQPGVAPERLPDNGRIPVERTSVTVGADLVNTILRRPYKERLSIIVNELGAAVAGNEENLNDAVRRASPALRETNEVLKQLADQNRTLVELTENADTVVGDLDDNRKEIGRWVLEARDTAKISATRKTEIAAGFRKLPGFLDELKPTMAALGETADAQTPALNDLRASADQLEEFLGRLGPFAEASRPAIDALGEASVTGNGALRSLRPVVTQLRRTARGLPELSKNLAIVLEHLDDPKNALEDDPRAAKATGRPAPTGYTGFESFLTYAYDQTLSTNIYDQNNHLLKIGAIGGGDCAPYADVERAKAVGDECRAALGPNSPGVNFPDTTDPGTAAARGAKDETPDLERRPGATPATPGGAAPGTADAPREGTQAAPGTAAPQAEAPARVGPIEIPQTLPGLPAAPSVPGAGAGTGKGPLSGLGLSRSSTRLDPTTQDRLLDFLLGS